jgi:hypothetical protein
MHFTKLIQIWEFLEKKYKEKEKGKNSPTVSFSTVCDRVVDSVNAEPQDEVHQNRTTTTDRTVVVTLGLGRRRTVDDGGRGELRRDTVRARTGARERTAQAPRESAAHQDDNGGDGEARGGLTATATTTTRGGRSSGKRRLQAGECARLQFVGGGEAR